jgi:hypothetical protein
LEKQFDREEVADGLRGELTGDAAKAISTQACVIAT